MKDSLRVDIVYDVYLLDSLKRTTREKRGKGVRKRVSPQTRIPSNWQEFLRVSENKTELFLFLSVEIVKRFCDKTVICSASNQVFCNSPTEDLSGINNCNHEEADSRIFIHLLDSITKGLRKATIRTVDTDVVVLALSCSGYIS